MKKDDREPDAKKVKHMQRLIAKVNQKTLASKRLAQRYRQVLADNRASAGFGPLLKEMVYPIFAEEARGAYITDIDGNTYLDFTMGCGAHLFGHSPEFITNSIRRQIELGMPLGSQSPIAGKVAELIADLTGHARVAFCNSETEATMTAVRLGRAKSGRSKVVTFRSLGTPDSMVEDTVVLEYCEESALSHIQRHGRDIAAVLVEPLPSRAPSLSPATFLRELRRITKKNNIALIFDEVITGFRCAPGGAQELFDVRADLCAYGKIVGGGMPIGVVAGSAAYMDCLDGGSWQHGDASFPGQPTSFFAGTFSEHPLTMAASLAVLEQIKWAGDPLYHDMNERTERLCQELDAVFEAEGADIRAERFGSLFRFVSSGNLDVFYCQVLAAGFFIWEGRHCFLSTEHTDKDLSRFVRAMRPICRDLVACELLPARAASKSTASALARTCCASGAVLPAR